MFLQNQNVILIIQAFAKKSTGFVVTSKRIPDLEMLLVFSSISFYYVLMRTQVDLYYITLEECELVLL